MATAMKPETDTVTMLRKHLVELEEKNRVLRMACEQAQSRKQALDEALNEFEATEGQEQANKLRLLINYYLNK